MNKIDKPLARLIKRKMERAGINRLEMKKKRKVVTTDIKEIQTIVNDYYMQSTS